MLRLLLICAALLTGCTPASASRHLQLHPPPRACLLVNWINVLFANVAATTESTILLFGLHINQLLVNLGDRLQRWIGDARQLAADITAKARHIMAGGWLEWFHLEPVDWLASRTNETLHWFAGRIARVGEDLEERLNNETHQLAAQLVHRVDRALGSTVNATGHPAGRCDYGFEKAVWIEDMSAIQEGIGHCVDGMAAEMMRGVKGIEATFREVQRTVSGLLRKLSVKTEFHQIYRVFHKIGHGISSMDEDGGDFHELHLIGDTFIRCPQQVMTRMEKFIARAEERVRLCL